VKKKKIAVNLLWLRTGQVGGSQEYLIRQLMGVSLNEEAKNEFQVTLFVQKGFAWQHPALAEIYKCVEAPAHRGARLARIALEQTWLAIKTRKFDAIHHGGGTMPRFGLRNTILTMHDVQYLSFPENFSRIRLTYLRKVVPNSLNSATVVTTPSTYVRDRLINQFNLPVEKVRVVRHGVDSAIGKDSTSEAELRQRFRLESKKVIFLPAITHPHKNHKFLLQLMKLHWTDKDLVLVCAGGKGRAEEEFMREIRRLNLDNRVMRMGRVSDSDRDGLMKLSLALVFPSLYEGFGAPVIEAMIVGTPVITSNCASLPEVVGDAGLVLPLELDAWADALQVVDAKREKFVAAGKLRATQYSIRYSGDDLIEAYKAAVII
jgi:alpha-1,3-rhamnosyl/mannosyltransferase